MPLFRKKEKIVRADQWFPDRKIEGVMGNDPNKMCGCILIGMDGNRPHIHWHGSKLPFSVKPGDWIINHGVGVTMLDDKVFQEAYETVEVKPEYEATEEVYAEWWKCSDCEAGYILGHFEFCPSCGKKLDWTGVEKERQACLREKQK